MDETLDPRDARAVLRNVGAYRQLRRHVRQKANWSLVFGAIMFAVWWMAFGQRGGKFNDPFSLIYLGLAVIEFGSGVVNKLFPSAEGVLIDGLVLFGFGAANLTRAALIYLNNKGQIDYFYVVLGAYWVFSGFTVIRSYAGLRRAFAIRPTAEHIRWFEGLMRDVRTADPEGDSTALDLPTRPAVRGKLLGDTGFFLQAGSDELIIAGRDEVEIERVPPKSPDQDPVGYLVVHGHDFGGFPLDPDNWRNYAAWKGLGGPPVVRPAGYTPDD
jgi:hypothetical protein